MRRPALLFGAALLAACATTPPPPLVPGTTLVWSAEDAALMTPGPVLVDVVASWCARCGPVLGRHAQAVAQTGGRVRHVAWSVDAGAEHLEGLLSGPSPRPTSLHDPGGRRLARLVAVTRLPTTLLLDAQGRLLVQHDQGGPLPDLASLLAPLRGPAP